MMTLLSSRLPRYCALAILTVVLSAPRVSVADNNAAAFLESGLGTRGPGLGGAFSAVVEGPSAAFWNPAGLAGLRGRSAEGAHQRLSLGRSQSNVAVGLNLRGDLGFGFAWIHAGVDGLTARTNSGEITGEIHDTEDAYLFALGVSPTPLFRLGASIKLIRQTVDVPQIGESTASGRGLDLGVQYLPSESTRVSLTARNVGARLQWTVTRTAAQTSTRRDPLLTDLVLGLCHCPAPPVLLAADLHYNAISPYANLGAEWTVSDLLTLRGGLHRLGQDDSPGSLAVGLSLRPMHSESLQFHYTYLNDPLDGTRLYGGLATRF